MYLVVVAGGIASGKSTVARRFEELGAARIDLDVLSRKVLEPGSEILPQIAAAFGDDVLDKDGNLDRALLASRAFASDEATAKLEAIEHPAIKARLLAELEVLESRSYKPRLCVIEIPLLDRALDTAAMADEVIAVVCPMELRRERAIERGMTGEDFDRRVAMQPSDIFLMEHADCVIINAGSLAELVGKVDIWWDRFMRGKPSPLLLN